MIVILWSRTVIRDYAFWRIRNKTLTSVGVWERWVALLIYNWAETQSAETHRLIQIPLPLLESDIKSSFNSNTSASPPVWHKITTFMKSNCHTLWTLNELLQIWQRATLFLNKAPDIIIHGCKAEQSRHTNLPQSPVAPKGQMLLYRYTTSSCLQGGLLTDQHHLWEERTWGKHAWGRGV